MLEVLIAVAIICTLIGLSMSGLAYARQAGKCAACSAQLRQFGFAMTLYRDQNRGALPFANELYSVPAGWLEPIASLEPYLDVAPPSLRGEALVVTGPPFLCPADAGYGPIHGMSYAYVPGVFMQVLPRRGAAERVTFMMEDDRSLPVMQDMVTWHFARRSGEEGGERNALAMDGSVAVLGGR